MMTDLGDAKSNRLGSEKSPYLLQHAGNPVDWFPWGPEAFKKAAEEDKPVFLSIGYSTCHWCHVMEKESFVDSDVAALMNECFISVKVDREERPDIDHFFMSACLMMTGQGGWPLTVIMTPDKQPFFAGTYFPKSSRFGRIGMVELIPRIQAMWNNERQRLIQLTRELSDSLKRQDLSPSPENPDESLLHDAYNQLIQTFDREQGGFGTAPKFPAPHILLFLLGYGKRTGNPEAIRMATKTLAAMRNGGIYDQVGCGFHRYSTDAYWHVPHFEKMLYDQAMLCLAYTKAYELTGDASYRKTAEEILLYVRRDMTSPEGVFFSAEDADSEGEEGKFYVWNYTDIFQVLGQEDALFACQLFGVEKDGNFTDPVSGEQTGTNILTMQRSPDELAAQQGVALKVIEDRIGDIRERLFASRRRRIHPHKDDKVLTDWNGLMIVAFARAAKAFQNPGYADDAARASDFILSRMRRPDGRLLHRYRDGEAAIPAFIDDYAFLIAGLIELYETTALERYLQQALSLNELCIRHFQDRTNGGFFFAPDDFEELPLRSKEIHDSAIPSGNSMALLNLYRLARMTDGRSLYETASETARAFCHAVRQSPSAYTFFLYALDFNLGEASLK